MDQYNPSYEITNQILEYVASISEKVGRISVTTNLDNKPHLRKNNKIKSVYSSLKIEANSLSLDQVYSVINGKIVLGKQKDIQEVKNAYETYEQFEMIDPYSIEDLKKYHGVMTKYLVTESGTFRKGEEGVFNGEKCIFMAPPAWLVPNLVQQLFTWINEQKDHVHPLILSCVFHYEFVFIHPFVDGNGRMARLWQNVILGKWNLIFEYLPIESQIEKFQSDYYDAIALCHKEGESTAFIEFMLKQIDQVLDDIVKESKDYASMSYQVKKLLDSMEYDVYYTSRELMGKLGLKSHNGFMKNYLHPALQQNRIEMTIPDKPRSKNQRYFKQ